MTSRDAQSGRVRGDIAPIPQPWWMWGLVGAAVFALGQLGVEISPPGAAIAAWWPAAGVAAWFILRIPRSQWWAALLLVFAAITLANLAAGREAHTSAAWGVANAVEIGILAMIVRSGGSARFTLRSIARAGRFALAVLAASSVFGVLVALIVAPDTADVVQFAAHAGASHAAAILMIAPFALLPTTLPQAVPWFEWVIQLTVLTATLALLVAGGSGLPLSFLPVGVLAWGAFRFPMRVAYAEALIAGVIVLAATVAGRGPFVTPTLDPQDSTLMVILYLFMTANFTLFLTAASYELRAASLAVRNVAELVTTGFVDSRVGLLVADDREPTWRVLLANSAARRNLEAELGVDDRWRTGPIRVVAEESLRTGQLMSCDRPGGRILNVDASRVSGHASRIAVQVVDVTESMGAARVRLEAERERAATLQAQLELERRQIDFVATASHELRTPITSIAGYLELLEESEELSPQSRDWLEVVQRNTTRLGYLIDDLLILARAQELTDRHLLVTAVAVSELIDDVLARYSSAARQRHVELVVGDHEGTVRGVRTELTHALASLVSNAVKFTPPGGHVRVDASPDRSTLAAPDGSAAAGVRITVRDSGPGIAADDLPHVFERFYRTREAEAAHAPGTGLGLAVAQELAHANGGTVELSSPGRDGVIAAVILPAAAEHAPTAR